MSRWSWSHSSDPFWDLAPPGLKLKDPLLDLGEGDDRISHHRRDPIHKAPVLGLKARGEKPCPQEPEGNQERAQNKGMDLRTFEPPDGTGTVRGVLHERQGAGGRFPPRPTFL